jgi:predicted nucleic acid-binding protein
MRVYVDTNCYIDIFEDRKNGYIDLAEFSFQVFRRIRKRKDILIISDWLEAELKNNNHLADYQDFIKGLKEESVGVEEIKTDEDDKKKARNYPKRADALHAILAAKANTDLLVTNNIQDFLEVQKLVKICMPREY